MTAAKENVTPQRHDEVIDASSFAAAARALNAAAAARGLATCSWRSPPRDERVQRAIRRRAAAPHTVIVRIADRPDADIIADMAAGLAHVNGADLDVAADLVADVLTGMAAGLERAAGS